MPGLLKTEAVVLRSIRYGEADRILHLYTPHRGRLAAIAKGVRRASSRFGGRLEPFFRLRIELHEGRGELLTVTGAQTVDGHPRLRASASALDAAARRISPRRQVDRGPVLLHEVQHRIVRVGGREHHRRPLRREHQGILARAEHFARVDRMQGRQLR